MEKKDSLTPCLLLVRLLMQPATNNVQQECIPQSAAARPSNSSRYKNNNSSTPRITPAATMDRYQSQHVAPIGFHQHQHHSVQQYSHCAMSPATEVSSASNEYDATDDDWSAMMTNLPVRLRRSSSADIPIPQFMIPCSANTLMNKRYALATNGARPVSSSPLSSRGN